MPFIINEFPLIPAIHTHSKLKRESHLSLSLSLSLLSLKTRVCVTVCECDIDDACRDGVSGPDIHVVERSGRGTSRREP